MSNTIVSVIVPTKNSANTLEDCLKSIKAQTYEYTELIVVDNFSSDSTYQIAKRYTKLAFQKGPERSAQRNFAVSKAKGEYVVIIDSDMELSPTVIQECISAMDDSNEAISGVVIPEESFGVGFWAQCKKLERSFYVGVPYMEAARFFKKSDFLDLGGYDQSMVSGEDWDLSQRMETLGKIKRIQSYIYHNEGHISLWKTVNKKYYYAQKFAKYIHANQGLQKLSQQTGLFGRYKLFFAHPIKLFKNPILGLGMLFMKSCEFAFGGFGYIVASSRGHREA